MYWNIVGVHVVLVSGVQQCDSVIHTRISTLSKILFPSRSSQMVEWSFLCYVRVKSLTHVELFATPWTVAYQAPLSMEFPGKNTGVCCNFLLQGIFPIQGSNPGLLHCRQTLLPSEPPGKSQYRDYIVGAM